MKETTICSVLSKIIVNTGYESIPEKVVEIIKDRILDTVGACLAGAEGFDYGKQLINSLTEDGYGDCPVFGTKVTLPLPYACMANTVFAHALELDDGHKNAGVHAGCAVVTSALTIGAKHHSSGKEVLAAIAIGYEITYRIAKAMNPAQLKRGFHPSSVCDTFGVAAVGAKLMGLDEEQTCNALGLAGEQAAGSMEAIHAAQACTGVMVGHSALAGILSVRLAKNGVIAPKSILEGKDGLFKSMTDNQNSNISADPSCEWLIAESYTKLYPNARHIHAAIEGLMFLMEKNSLTCGRIEKVIVETYQVAIDTCGKIWEPKTNGEAKFSIPYALAAIMVDGYLSVSHMAPEAFTRRDLVDAAYKVEIRLSERINNEYPAVRGCNVIVKTTEDETFEQYTSKLKGSPDLPVTRAELADKFRNNINTLLPENSKEKVIEQITAMEGTSGIEDLIKEMMIQ